MEVTKSLFTFKGRASVKFFWIVIVLFVIVQLLLALLGTLIFGNSFIWDIGTSIFTVIFGVIYIIQLTMFLWIFLATCIKRLHDRDKPGWVFLYTLIPIVQFFYYWEIMFLPGSPFDNEYGPPVNYFEISRYPKE